MSNERDLNHYRRLAGIPVDLSQQPKKLDTKVVTEAAKVPQHRGELAPKTKKNMRQRVSNAKKALEYLELAREELMQLPAIDYMEDIPDVIKQLHLMLHGEDGTGGLHNLHRSYAREFEAMEFPEDLENTDPGMDGNPTEEEIKAKEKEKEKKAAQKDKDAGKKPVKENADSDESMLDQNPFDDESEQEEEENSKPEWLEKAEVKAEEKEGKKVSKAEKKKVESEEEEKSKPEWLEKAEVKAEEKEGKKVSKKEMKKVGESACSCGCNPKNCNCGPNCSCGCGKKKAVKESAASRSFFSGGEWTKSGSDLGKKFAADADLNKSPAATIPSNVNKSEQGDLVYPVSDRSEGPNQMQTNPYNEHQKVHVPAAIKTALMNEIKEAEKNAAMFLSRKDNDSKNFYEDMAKAFAELHLRLDEGTLYSMKQAQILMTSMMNIFTSKIPPEVVKFIAAGGTVRPLKDYMKQVTGNFDQWHIRPTGDTVPQID